MHYTTAKVILVFHVQDNMLMNTNVYLNGHIKIFLIIYTLLIVKMFKLPGLIRCEPPADYVSSLHLPYPCDCLNISLSSALCHFCIVVWPVAIL